MFLPLIVLLGTVPLGYSTPTEVARKYFHSAIHQRVLSNYTLQFYVYSQDDEKSISESRQMLIQFLSPCDESTENTNLTVFEKWISCEHDSQLNSHFGADLELKNLICNQSKLEEQQEGTQWILRKRRVFLLYSNDDQCRCKFECDRADPFSTVIRSPSCRRNGCGLSRRGRTCSFANDCKEDWIFENRLQNRLSIGNTSNYPQFQLSQKRVAGVTLNYASATLNRGAEQSAALVSQLIQQTSAKCTLHFKYYIWGARDTTLMVMLTEKASNDTKSIQLKTLRNVYNNQMRNGQRWRANTFYETSVSVGHISRPFRVRFECRPDPIGNLTSECALTSIKWSQCEGHDFTFARCEHVNNPFVCNKTGHLVCLEDVACDGLKDCADGEDEKSCDALYPSSSCNFDNSLLCDGWESQSRLLASDPPDEHMQSVFMTATAQPSGYIKPTLPESNWKTYSTLGISHEARAGAGPFLVYAPLWSQYHNMKGRISTIRSPLFPPTTFSEQDVTGTSTCSLRFRYCILNSPLEFKIELVPEVGKSTNLWKTLGLQNDIHEYMTPMCEWKKASVSIQRQMLPFRIEISADYSPLQSEHFVALDDISLNPSCFHARSSPLSSSIFNITSCGQSGRSPPGHFDCLEHLQYNMSEAFVDAKNGLQTWTSPKDSFYWIKSCGAAGGSFPASNHSENGSCVTTRIFLPKGNPLNITVGQRGETFCDEDSFMKNWETTSVYDVLCRGNQSLTGTIRNTLLPGAGGGGATFIKSSMYNPLLVAGGGGGAYPEELLDESTRSPSSRLLFNNGADIPKCNGTCLLTYDDDLWKRCLENRRDFPFPSRGGFGGGASVCGQYGGGGAGYVGGSPRSQKTGESGTSFVDSGAIEEKDSLIESQKNAGDGYALIYVCDLNCTGDLTCQFPTLHEPIKKCLCPNGEEPDENGECVPAASLERSMVHALFIIVPIIAVFVLIVTPSFSLFLRKGGSCTCWNWKTMMSKQRKEDRTLFYELLNRQKLSEIRDEKTLMSMSDEDLLKLIPRIPQHLIHNKQEIGSGAFGVVFSAQLYVSGEREDVAVKQLNEALMSTAAKRQFIMEAVLMRISSHDNDSTIRLIGASFDAAPYMIVMEYMSGGNLLDYLRCCRANEISSNPENKSTQDLVKMALDIALGCVVIENLGYVHRDLAARNCLLTCRGKGMRVKIGDFGLAKQLTNVYYRGTGGHTALAIKWMPPEAVEDEFFCLKTDVWSFGVVCWEIFSLGRVPYPSESKYTVMNILSKGERLSAPPGTPEKIYKLMKECWSTDPERRPSFSTIQTYLEDCLQDPDVVNVPFPSTLDPRWNVESPCLPSCTDTPCTIQTEINTPSDMDMYAFAYNHSAVPYTKLDESAKQRLMRPEQTTICVENVDDSANGFFLNNEYLVVDREQPLRNQSTASTPMTSEEALPERPNRLLLPPLRH